MTLKSRAELVAGRRDSASTSYRRFDESDWQGDRAQHKPTELYTKEIAYEVEASAKDLASDLLRLVTNADEIGERLTSLVRAWPALDAAGAVLKEEILLALAELHDEIVQ